MISIIIPTYTNAGGLAECLKSIGTQTPPGTEYEVIVVANGAPPETRQLCFDQPAITRVRGVWFDKPIGFTRAANEGAKVAKGDYLVLLNDDCVILGPQWLGQLIAPMEADPKVGLTGPQKEWDPNSNRTFLIFFCVAIRRACWDALHGLDEVFNPGFGEDSVTGDTPVIIRRDGVVEVVPIEDLYSGREDGRLPVRRTEVYTRSGWSPLTHCYRHTVRKRILRLRTQSYVVNFTPDHSVFAGGRPTPVSELTVGNRVDVMEGDPLQSSPASVGDAWEQGFFVAEGSASVNVYQRASARGRHKEYPQTVATATVTQYGDVGSERIDRVCGTWGWRKGSYAARASRHVRYYRAEFVGRDRAIAVQELIGNYYTEQSKEKKVPAGILNASDAVRSEFLEGYWTGDGHVAHRTARRPEASFTTKSPTLAFGVQLLLRTLGRETTVNVRADKPQIQNVRVLNGKNGRDTKFHDTGILPKADDGTVRSITDVTALYADENGLVPVYDLTTEDHSFIAGGIVAHNTDFCIRAEGAGWTWKVVPSEEGHFLADHPNNSTLPAWKQTKMWVSEYPLYHDGEQTLGKMPGTDKLLERNRMILRLRHDLRVDIGRALQTDGWMSPQELRWLAMKAGEHHEIVEVGSWHGRSSRAIADGMGPGAHLWCIDTFNGSSGEPDFHRTAAERQGDDAYLHFCNALADHIAAGRVRVLRMASANAVGVLRGLGVRPDMIFIDGDHSRPGIDADLANYTPLLELDGLLCGHDYFEQHQAWMQVFEAVNEFFPTVEQVPDTSIWIGHLGQRRKVFDCFPFFNELDVLELRFAELDSVVDRWVITEGTRTYQGQAKALLFDKHKERFARWLPKITYLVVDDFPETDDPWVRERWQRDALMRGLGGCWPEDIIILGDADEIPSADAVRRYDNSMGLVRLKQRLFYGYANREDPEGWDWQKIAPYQLVKERTPCGIRYPEASEVELLLDGGWHFSFMGGPASWREKITAYAHHEFNTPETLEGLERRATAGEDPLGRDRHYVEVDDYAAYPMYLRENRAKFIHWFRLFPQGKDLPLTPPPPKPIAPAPKTTVTACVSTKDRYTTTLPMCLLAIANQTRPPDRLVIYDDGEQKDLAALPPFDGILHLCDMKKIQWERFATPRQGQVQNHQHALTNAQTDLIWRVDDDEAPEPTCLERLLEELKDDVGAVAGLVLVPGQVNDAPGWLDGTLAQIDQGPNLQWCRWNGGPRDVEHLYSTFLYRVEAGRKHGYPAKLSRIGHREETLFTHQILREGYRLVVTPRAITWHFQQMTGGIRTPDSKREMWEADERVFADALASWGVERRKALVVVLDCGIGDHLAFQTAYPKIKAAHPERDHILAVCYPELFEGERRISIADAKQMLGDKFEQTNFYKWMWDHNWTRTLPEAWEEMYR